MSEFLHMGGYGAYVWSSMGVAFLLMLLEPVALKVKRRAVITQIKRTKRLEERRLQNENN